MPISYDVVPFRSGRGAFSYLHFTFSGATRDGETLAAFRGALETTRAQKIGVYVVDLTDSETRLSVDGYQSLLKEISTCGFEKIHFGVITNAPEDEDRYVDFDKVSAENEQDVAIDVFWSAARLDNWLEALTP